MARRRGRAAPRAVVGGEVLGLGEVVEAFQALPPKIQKTLVASGIYHAAEVALREQHRYVPVGPTGTLFKSLQIFAVRKGKTVTRVFVGADKTGWYGRLVEDGHRARDGSWVAARPWVRPALHTSFRPAVAAFSETVREGLPAVVEDVARAAGSKA